VLPLSPGASRPIRFPRIFKSAGTVIYVKVRKATPWQSRAMDSDRFKPTPICPSCGKPMRFARAIPRIGGLSELRTYDCRDCGVAVTEQEEPGLRRELS